MKKVNLDLIIAEASGNMTAFVVYPVDPRLRIPYGNKIMQVIDDHNIEQVGFIAPSYEDKPLRLDMMGKEFCANATRAYGYYSALCDELTGKQKVEVYVSGSKGPTFVEVDMDKETAVVEMPRAEKIAVVEMNGKDYTAVVYEGTAHVIVENEKASEEKAKELIRELKTIYDLPSLGALFLDRENSSMIPYIYVEDGDNFKKVNSCGSGSAAVATYLTRNIDDDVFEMSLKQPKGIIEIKAVKDSTDYTIYIGGDVKISEKEQIIFDVEDEAFAFVKKAKDEVAENYKKEKENK